MSIMSRVRFTFGWKSFAFLHFGLTVKTPPPSYPQTLRQMDVEASRPIAPKVEQKAPLAEEEEKEEEEEDAKQASKGRGRGGKKRSPGKRASSARCVLVSLLLSEVVCGYLCEWWYLVLACLYCVVFPSWGLSMMMMFGGQIGVDPLWLCLVAVARLCVRGS